MTFLQIFITCNTTHGDRDSGSNTCFAPIKSPIGKWFKCSTNLLGAKLLGASWEYKSVSGTTRNYIKTEVELKNKNMSYIPFDTSMTWKTMNTRRFQHAETNIVNKKKKCNTRYAPWSKKDSHYLLPLVLHTATSYEHTYHFWHMSCMTWTLLNRRVNRNKTADSKKIQTGEQSILWTYDVVNFSWKPFSILKNLFVWWRGVPSFITKLSKYPLPLNKSSSLSVQFKALRGALDPLACCGLSII